VAVLKPRERLVYFRITEDEFQQFASVCEQSGARSVSDLARNAVQRLIADCQKRQQLDQMEEKMRVLETLITAVTQQLQVLTLHPIGDGAHDRVADQFFPDTNPSGHSGRKEH
jgi:hypothetical protein